MAKRRMRVCIGYKDDGSPIVTQVSADTELELSDKIIQTVLKSARRSEFVQIAEQAAAEELPMIPTFENYTEEEINTALNMLEKKDLLFIAEIDKFNENVTDFY